LKFQLTVHQRIANPQLSHSLHWFHLRNYISDLINYQFFLHENQFNFQFSQAVSRHHSTIDSWYSNFTSILTPPTSTVKALTGLAVLIISSSEAMTDANQQEPTLYPINFQDFTFPFTALVLIFEAFFIHFESSLNPLAAGTIFTQLSQASLHSAWNCYQSVWSLLGKRRLLSDTFQFL